MAVDPYKRVQWRGKTVNQRTKEMLEITELRALRDLTPLGIVQGSYNKGVSQSGGTHDGGGALDISVFGMTAAQRDRVLRELRETSFAAWYRPPIPGVWGAHIHAIAIGDQEMSPQAAQQVVWYKQGLNGLWPNGGGPDTGPKVPIHVYRQDIDMSYYGPDKWDSEDWKEFRRQIQAIPITDAVSEAAGDTMALDDVLANDRKRLYDTKTVVNGLDTKVDAVLVGLGKLTPPA